jgi:hypothetical protein
MGDIYETWRTSVDPDDMGFDDDVEGIPEEEEVK